MQVQKPLPIESLPFSPHLENELLLLQQLTPSDFERLFSVAADPLIWQQHPERERYKPEIFRRFFDGALVAPMAYIIIDQATGEVVGSSRYYYLTPEEISRYKSVSPSVAHAVTIGYTFLARSHWGGRYNSALKQLMINHAFEMYDSVVFQVGVKNIRSRTAVERLGAVLLPLEDELPDHAGAYDAHVIYELRKEMWGSR